MSFKLRVAEGERADCRKAASQAILLHVDTVLQRRPRKRGLLQGTVCMGSMQDKDTSNCHLLICPTAPLAMPG